MKEKHFKAIQNLKGMPEVRGSVIDLYLYVHNECNVTGRAEIDFRLGHFENVISKQDGVGEIGGLFCNLTYDSTQENTFLGKFGITGPRTDYNPWSYWGYNWEGAIHEVAANIKQPFRISKTFLNINSVNSRNMASNETQQKLYQLYQHVLTTPYLENDEEFDQFCWAKRFR